jgi:hypothetical protein
MYRHNLCPPNRTCFDDVALSEYRSAPALDSSNKGSSFALEDKPRSPPKATLHSR